VALTIFESICQYALILTPATGFHNDRLVYLDPAGGAACRNPKVISFY